MISPETLGVFLDFFFFHVPHLVYPRICLCLQNMSQSQPLPIPALPPRSVQAISSSCCPARRLRALPALPTPTRTQRAAFACQSYQPLALSFPLHFTPQSEAACSQPVTGATPAGRGVCSAAATLAPSAPLPGVTESHTWSRVSFPRVFTDHVPMSSSSSLAL